MHWSFNLFRVAGIRLRVHITFVLILIWGAYYWGGIANDGLRGALFGIAATLLLFLCVTLHELGHATQARAYGIPTEDITLYPLGGVARLQEIPAEPAKEFRIAIAGPLVNVVLVGLLIVIGWAAGVTALRWPSALFDDLRDPTWKLLIPYLTFANLSLAIFNLLPAFPMDGGRILRSLLAMRLSYRRATGIAVVIGQAMAFLFGLYGFAYGEYFLILIAIFVWIGAGQEGAQTSIRGLLGNTRVDQAMIRQPWSLAPEFPLSRAVELTLSTAQSDFPVQNRDGSVVGLLTLPDLLAALQQRPNASVGEAMREDFPTARPDEKIVDVQERLAQHHGRAVPVVTANGQLAGLLTAADVGEVIQVLTVEADRAGHGAAPRPNSRPAVGDG
jgi:Zn-dependent protease